MEINNNNNNNNDNLEMMLTKDQLDFFDKYGYVVIDGVLSDSEVEKAKQTIAKLLPLEKMKEDLPRVKSKMTSHMFYGAWKLLDLHLHPNVYSVMKHLMVHTFGTKQNSLYNHPFSKFDDILPYVDHVGYRLPDSIRADGGLSLHMDRKPHKPYESLRKWRPIQSFITLTDHYGSNTGGLQVVAGFHKEEESFFAKFPENHEGKGGEFFRMDGNTYSQLEKRLEPVQAPKGSLVCWDNRLPHATTPKYDGIEPRQVIFAGWLPDIELNRNFCHEQADTILSNIAPPLFQKDLKACDRDWKPENLNQFQKRMLLPSRINPNGKKNSGKEEK